MTHIQSTVTDVSKFGRVGVLYGGTSSEREISLLSGQAIYAALKNLGINAVAIDAQDDVLQQLIQHELDYVFIALHGPGGEDGTVQGALEYLQLPYTGSGVLASALAMDKQRCKQLWKGIGLPTCDFIILNEDTDWKAALVDLGGKAMVKPASEGSSIGMRPVENADQLKSAWLHAASFDSVVIAEPLLAYTGSGVLASALAMDKQRCKQLWKGIGLPTCDFIILNEDTDWKAALVDLGGKAMVKPASEGSSIGMRPVENADQLKSAWLHAASFDSVVIAEPLLEGEEYTVAVLGNKALPSIRIRSEEIFYDYKAKYFSDETSYFCPSGLSEAREEEIRQLSLDAFNSLGCIGWGRVDLMVDRQGNFQLLEVNTVPGMTSHSLVPMAAIASGIEFDQLVLQILQEALR